MGLWTWLSGSKPVHLTINEGWIADEKGFKYNLKRAVIADYLFDEGNRDFIGQNFVRNIAQAAYREHYHIGPTAASAEVDEAWDDLGNIPFGPWLDEARSILARNDMTEKMKYLIPG